jgi:hypothetical protein
MKPYGWKPRANEYVGRRVERLARVVSKRFARREGEREMDPYRSKGEVSELEVEVYESPLRPDAPWNGEVIDLYHRHEYDHVDGYGFIHCRCGERNGESGFGFHV